MRPYLQFNIVFSTFMLPVNFVRFVLYQGSPFKLAMLNWMFLYNIDLNK